MADTAQRLVALPDRANDVVGGLPDAFRQSHVDYLPNSVCWYRDRWLIASDIWGDRRLAEFDPDSGSWTEFPTPAGWIRRPMSAGGDRLSLLRHDHHADHGQQLVLLDDRWEAVDEEVDEFAVTDWDGEGLARRGPDGNAAARTVGGAPVRVAAAPDGGSAITGPGWQIPIPRGAVLSHLSPAPDRDAMLAVVRRGGSHQIVVFSATTGRALSARPLREVVQPTSAWLDDTRVAICVEEWPSLVPYVWDWSRGSLDRIWALGTVGTARSLAAAPDGTCVAAVGTPAAQRAPRQLDDPSPFAGAMSGAGVRTVVVRRGNQLLPCLVHEPPRAGRGTTFFVAGGPYVPVWGEYAALARALNELGWRVVRVNLRSSGLRQPEYRPEKAVAFGVDDVADLCAVIEELATGPVVTMGMSYGGYVSALAGELSDRCVGVAVLGGFMHHDDIAGTAHPGVRQFAELAFRDREPRPAGRLRKRYFLAHGELDARIPLPAVRRHLSRMDQEATLVVLEGEGHAIRTDRGARLAYPPLLRWMDETRERRVTGVGRVVGSDGRTK